MKRVSLTLYFSSHLWCQPHHLVDQRKGMGYATTELAVTSSRTSNPHNNHEHHSNIPRKCCPSPLCLLHSLKPGLGSTSRLTVSSRTQHLSISPTLVLLIFLHLPISPSPPQHRTSHSKFPTCLGTANSTTHLKPGCR